MEHKLSTHLPVIEKSPMFQDVNREDIASMLSCLSASVSNYPRNQFIIHAGDPVDDVGMILTGSATILQEDFWGNRNILAKIIPGQLFAETFACIGDTPSKVSVIAGEPSTVLFLNVNRILTTCSSTCTFHSQLIRNLVSILAQKNLSMNDKILHVTQRTTREKLLSYLSEQALKNGTSSFEIPFNRQQLADYLSVDRSAMSNELCKLRDEGLLAFNRNRFELHLESR